MSAPDRPVRVADYVTAPASVPAQGPALATRAAEQGYDRVLVWTHATKDDWLVAHPRPTVTIDGEERRIEKLTLAELRPCVERPATLEETMLAAHKANIGLVVRLTDTTGIHALAGALGIMEGEDTSNLRRRYLVAVPNQRIGRRLRSDANPIPSARWLEPSGGGWKGALARRFPNLARAACDADDLIVDARAFSPERVRNDLVPHLARRAAFAWVALADASQESDYADAGVGGFIIGLPAS